jgi:hypothetical protein
MRNDDKQLRPDGELRDLRERIDLPQRPVLLRPGLRLERGCRLLRQRDDLL